MTKTDYDQLGQAVLEAICQGSMVHGSCPYCDCDEGMVLVWDGNTAEQIGETIRRLFDDEIKKSVEAMKFLAGQLIQADTALLFYADRRNWKQNPDSFTDMEFDMGGRARNYFAKDKQTDEAH